MALRVDVDVFVVVGVAENRTFYFNMGKCKLGIMDGNHTKREISYGVSPIVIRTSRRRHSSSSYHENKTWKPYFWFSRQEKQELDREQHGTMIS